MAVDKGKGGGGKHIRSGSCGRGRGWGQGLDWAPMWQLTKKKRLKTKRRYLMRLRQLSWADIFA